MAVLTIIDGKLRAENNALVLSDSVENPCCCGGCTYFWFGICNINSAVDDNMNVSINGKNLGVMDLNANNRVGWIVHTGPQPTQQQIPWDAGCYSYAVFKKINKADLKVGSNGLSTTLAQANNNGNYGVWGCGLWSTKAGETCPSLASGTYGSPPQTFSWTLTQAQYTALRV